MTGFAADLEDVEVRTMHPYQAAKHYVCPGCHHDIAAGTGHLVVIPRRAPDLRRHWHRACWHRKVRTRTR